MIATRTKGIAKLGVACQCILVTAAFWFWMQLSQTKLWDLDLRRYVLYNALLLIGIVIAYATTAATGSWFTQQVFFECHRHAFRQTAYAAGLLFMMLVGEQDKTISRIFLFTFMPVLYLVLVLSLRSLPPWLARWSFGSVRIQRMLLAGSTKRVVPLEGWLKSKQRLGWIISGMVCQDRDVGTVEGIKIWGALEDIERVIVEQDITHVVVVEIPVFRHLLAHYTEVCERRGVRLQVICDFERTLGHPVTLFEDEGIRFLGLREEPLEDPFGRFLKRSFDIAVSLPVLIFVLPFTTLMVAIAQRMYAPGPIFYRQLRSGLQNVPFAIFKYRTMYVGNFDPSRQASVGDSRIYPAGHWMRRFSIDELPQFLNVLLGHMSVVGPRPHLLEHDEQFARAMANYLVRAGVKPGITGLAQVRGHRGETKTVEDVVKRVESDIQYLENWSFWMDCWIVMRTASQVVFPPQSAR